MFFPHVCQLNTLMEPFQQINSSYTGTKHVEVQPGKILNINSWFKNDEEAKLIDVLKNHTKAFSWDYKDMKGIHLIIFTHHIYTENIRPFRQPQRRINLALRDIVKQEIEKLLQVGFIYPISNSQWVSPLVIVPKNNGKWRICVEYRELNKATLRDYFPLPFIDQVLDNLSSKQYFSFLDGFSGYNQIIVTTEDQDKTTFTCPWGTFSYMLLSFGLCNAPATFQRVVLAILVDLTNDCVEVYMDEFTMHGDTFDDALKNLDRVLTRCEQHHLSLSLEKFLMMVDEGIVLGHHISKQGFRLTKTKSILFQTYLVLKPPQISSHF